MLSLQVSQEVAHEAAAPQASISAACPACPLWGTRERGIVPATHRDNHAPQAPKGRDRGGDDREADRDTPKRHRRDDREDRRRDDRDRDREDRRRDDREDRRRDDRRRDDRRRDEDREHRR